MDHIHLRSRASEQPYSAPSGGRTPAIYPVDRQSHGQKILGQAKISFDIYESQTDKLPLSDEYIGNGTIIVLEGSTHDFPLYLPTLTQHVPRRASEYKWILLAVHSRTESTPETATVWVSDKYRSKFLQYFEDYLNQEKDSSSGNPRNNKVVSNISRIRRAVLDDIWTSSWHELPKDGQHWWTVFFHKTERALPTTDELALAFGIPVAPITLEMDNHFVLHLNSNIDTLNQLVFAKHPIAEVRRASVVENHGELSPEEQTDYALDLMNRIIPAVSEDSPAVCILDTGVFQGHLLLRDSLSPDSQFVYGNLSTSKVDTHGTTMAGLALYGDLASALDSVHSVELKHRLESVKIIPARGEQPHDFMEYGTVTTAGIALAESHVVRNRVFCLAATAVSDDIPGRPSLWSAMLDALAAGVDVVRDGNNIQLISSPGTNNPRVIFVSAGNVDRYDEEHIENSQSFPIEEPAQAWNVLTVGAFTDMDQPPANPDYSGYSVVALKGDLSPHSRTSVGFDDSGQSRWPIKPEICLEGGNIITDGSGLFDDRVSKLSLTTTGTHNDSHITTSNATSAATAQAARLAALAKEKYPDFWPETIRGLLVHTAEWTPAMRKKICAVDTKTKRADLLRHFGWGVPRETRVLHTSKQSVTMVRQEEFQPYHDSEFKLLNFQLHSFPWPRDLLSELGSEPIRVRITLSYFIEPSPSRRGWNGRYAYPSHALRFDLKGRAEDSSQFLARMDRAANETDPKSDNNRWLLGPQKRHLGSLHQDEWTGLAAELATTDQIAVYPVTGRWKQNKSASFIDAKIRYSLLVSLKTRSEEIDLYTPIKNAIRTPVDVPIASS